MNIGKGTILYIGGFVLPDGNAAAQRVVANAKLFSAIGYNVVFLNYSKDAIRPRRVEYFGFECFECPDREWSIASRMDVDRIEEILSERPDIGHVVAYNYPALSLLRLIRLCRAKGVKCIGDITEWYRARDVSVIKMPLKYVDTALRMRVLLSRMDGLIVISEYLQHYYESRVPTVLLPPMVDTSESKWASLDVGSSSTTTLVYAGKPSRTKERLDLVVDAVVSLPQELNMRLDVVGITAEEFAEIYGGEINDPRIVFRGRVSHEEAVMLVKRADYSVIVRDDNLVTRAGFPTKFSESVTCGTPVICNENSDLGSWVEQSGCGFVVGKDSLGEDLIEVLSNAKPEFDSSVFDYRNFRLRAAGFFCCVEAEKER